MRLSVLVLVFTSHACSLGLRQGQYITSRPRCVPETWPRTYQATHRAGCTHSMCAAWALFYVSGWRYAPACGREGLVHCEPCIVRGSNLAVRSPSPQTCPFSSLYKRCAYPQYTIQQLCKPASCLHSLNTLLLSLHRLPATTNMAAATMTMTRAFAAPTKAFRPARSARVAVVARAATRSLTKPAKKTVKSVEQVRVLQAPSHRCWLEALPCTAPAQQPFAWDTT